MQTAVNNQHFALIHNAYCGFSFSITRKKFMKGQNYSYLMKTFVSHMKFMFQTQFLEYIPCFKSTKFCLTIQKLCLLERTSIHILKLDNTNPIFPPTVILKIRESLQQQIFLFTAVIKNIFLPFRNNKLSCLFTSY